MLVGPSYFQTIAFLVWLRMLPGLFLGCFFWDLREPVLPLPPSSDMELERPFSETERLISAEETELERLFRLCFLLRADGLKSGGRDSFFW